MKQYLLGIVSLALAVTFSAFTGKQHGQSQKMFTNYYGFTGSDNADLNQTGSWVSLGAQAPAQCGGANVVCIVSAPQSNLTDFRAAIANADPQNEAQLDAMSGVDIYSHKD